MSSHRQLSILCLTTGLIALAGASGPVTSQAASFAGRVLTPEGRAAAGATVTVSDAADERRVSVYTAEDGSFAVETPFAGRLKVRARLAGFEDAATEQTMYRQGFERLELRLPPFASRESASDSLSASAFNARLPWRNVERDRAAFVSQCNYCHQMGNATTRVPRSHAEWMSTLGKMEDMLALLSAREKATVADVLTRGFDGKPIEAHQSYGAGPQLAKAKVKEWAVGDGMSFVHDAYIAKDQKLYGTDEGHDILWVLDRATGEIARYPMPDIDLPRGGHFSGMRLPVGVFTGKHGPHSMAETSDGRIWITNSLSSTLMSFDPRTKRFKSYPVGHDALYPHTARVDRNDIVWFTILVSNQIGRFDPKTEQMTVIELPANGFLSWITRMDLPALMRVGSWFPNQAIHLNFSTHKIFGAQVLPFPYGIDVHPVDGSIWYAKLHANKIGRIDPVTLDIKEWDTPMSGPRRPRFDGKGIFWIPSFDEGGLMRFDPATQEFEAYKIPAVGAGEYETPYALNVDPASGDVWMSANNSDRVLRFSPATKTFVSYPSPTRVTVLRDFSFAEDGSVCSSSSNLPAYAIEGGRGSFICIEPEGGAKDRRDLAASQARLTAPR